MMNLLIFFTFPIFFVKSLEQMEERSYNKPCNDFYERNPFYYELQRILAKIQG